MLLKKCLSSITLFFQKSVRSSNKELKVTLFVKILSLLVFLNGSAQANETNCNELSSLNPRLNTKYYVKIPSEAPESLNPPVESRRTVRTERFAKNVEKLEQKFKNLHRFKSKQRQDLLDKYEDMIRNMAQKLTITQSGLDDFGFDISSQTKGKIKYLITFYKDRDTSFCVFF